MKTLHDLFLDQLADVYYAEKQLVKALPKVAKAATNEHLREAIEAHLEETEGHVNTLEKVFKNLGETPRGKKCQAILGILEEGEEMIEAYEGSPALDAAIVAAAQKAEHYEITTYGCLVEWAAQLEQPDAATSLEAILDDEKAADTNLTKLAREVLNESAEAGEEKEATGKKQRSRESSSAR
jgi:ferritin-like metal-binding protein YciE